MSGIESRRTNGIIVGLTRLVTSLVKQTIRIQYYLRFWPRRTFYLLQKLSSSRDFPEVLMHPSLTWLVRWKVFSQFLLRFAAFPSIFSRLLNSCFVCWPRLAYIVELLSVIDLDAGGMQVETPDISSSFFVWIIRLFFLKPKTYF